MYSQFGEEEIIKEILGDNFIGGCIDVGASNGISISNTKMLEDQGWYCLCIEPNPSYFNELKNNRKNSVNYAISDISGNMKFNIVNCNGSEEAMSGLKLDQRLIKQHLDYGLSININSINIDVITLDTCIEKYYKYDSIDLISIDTEGTELDVLKGFSIEKWNPKLFVIENNFDDIDIEIYLNLFGYKKYKRLVVNDFYIKE